MSGAQCISIKVAQENCPTKVKPTLLLLQAGMWGFHLDWPVSQDDFPTPLQSLSLSLFQPAWIHSEGNEKEIPSTDQTGPACLAPIFSISEQLPWVGQTAVVGTATVVGQYRCLWGRGRHSTDHRLSSVVPTAVIGNLCWTYFSFSQLCKTHLVSIIGFLQN